jgi:hypothetical protein
LWEVTRFDEDLPGEVAAPIQEFPVQPHWKAIPVPSTRTTRAPIFLMRIASGIARASMFRRARLVVFHHHLSGEQPEHHGLRQRRLLRLSEEQLRPIRH